MSALRSTAAIALAALVTALTSTALADGDPSPPDGTPLALRPTKPLELAPPPRTSSVGWKVGAAALLLGGAAFWVRRRLPGQALAEPGLRVVRRAHLGGRNELLVVEVEGQRLLLGMTSQSIQTLAELEAPPQAPDVDAPAETAPSDPAIKRFQALLDAASSEPRGPRVDRAASAAEPGEDEEADAGQARGLAALAKGRR